MLLQIRDAGGLFLFTLYLTLTFSICHPHSSLPASSNYEGVNKFGAPLGTTCQSLVCVVVDVHSLSHVWLFATPWIAERQASLSFTISQSLLKLMSIESVMPSNHLVLCHLLLLLPSIFPSIRVFSNELALHIRWPKYWSFSFSISPSNGSG